MKYDLGHIRKKMQAFSDQHPDGVVLIWGPTASGKTSLSLKLAEHFPVEVISADSRQVYRGMDIGTDKVTTQQRAEVPHHLIDSADPDETFTAGEWRESVLKLVPQVHKRGNIPVIAGGTGLYFDIIYKNFDMPDAPPDETRREQMLIKEKQQPGYLHEQLQQVDPEEAVKHHPNSTRFILRALEIYEHTGKPKSYFTAERPVKRPILMIGLRDTKDPTNRRINARIKEMFEEGLVEEVQGLLDKGYTPELTSMQGIGYKEIVGYLQGQYDIEKAEELLKRNTHHLGKKQRSWFRRYIADSKQQPKKNVTYLIYQLS